MNSVEQDGTTCEQTGSAKKHQENHKTAKKSNMLEGPSCSVIGTPNLVRESSTIRKILELNVVGFEGMKAMINSACSPHCLVCVKCGVYTDLISSQAALYAASHALSAAVDMARNISLNKRKKFFLR